MTSTDQTQSLPFIEKKQFTTRNFKTFGGKTIKRVDVGWESYGNLNKNKDNVILITHYFTGNSHAAGKYTESDLEVGYWDSIIGPNKAIDTNLFFVISVDSLVNVSAFDKDVITTGPATINPDTGKPYGLDFPIVTIRDFVNVQKLVLESLGISKLHAVAGPSMGSMQAIEWASTYPDWVDRLISVIGSGSADAWTTAALEQWVVPITLDANYRDGDYYQFAKEEWPRAGLTHALALITQSALHPAFFNQIGKQIDFKVLDENILQDIKAKPSIVNWLYERASARADLIDANHLIYLVRANQLFITGMQGSLEEGLANIKAKVLLIPASDDLLLMPYHAEKLANYFQDKDHAVQLRYLESNKENSRGHLEGVAGIAEHNETINAFLTK
ncbi:E22 family MetX-like putative esterase [Glaciecola petra]|uniref:Probable acyltransferase n=1 Tax=Glaciecola petra TaxID=3075602 RepID=A0ABU2ZMW8_9ALTE|nr:homoserine O-acetyltransferase [Aestuariibacter sp. P117]MDT0593971.1 homoserine O-acetyltransferase [Aestuariibacter sp. P117]